MSSAPDADLDRPRPLGQSARITESPSQSSASLHTPTAQPVQKATPPADHESLCQALFGAFSPPPRSDSFLFEQKYSWRDCGPTPPCDRFQIGDLQAEKILPPEPTDYTDAKTCEENRYVQQTRPERLYPLVPPRSSLRCAHGQEITLPETGSRVWQQGPTLLQGWSHAELRLNGEGANSYSAYCLKHRRQEEHATSQKRQREDFDLVCETESQFASGLPGGKSSTQRSPTASADERVAGNQIGLDTASSGSGLVHERWRPFDPTQFPAPLFASIPIALADQRPLDMSRLTLIQRDLRPEGLSRTAMPTDHTGAAATSETGTRDSNAQKWFNDWLNLDEHPREEELDELERRLFDEPVSGEGVGDLRTQDHDSLDVPHEDDDIAE